MKTLLTFILTLTAFSFYTQNAADACYWIEPDQSYQHPNTTQWPGSPGNSADNYSDPINLGWNFTYFGTVYNQVVLTTKGTIVLGNSGYIDFTPSSFPNPFAQETSDQHNHICGFWTDFDFGSIGELYFKVTDEALYVNYVDVGFWPNQEDLTNSFQMIICKDGSDVIGDGNNVQFYYKDMQWANSEINGAPNGFNASNNFANVGCDQVQGEHHMQFGRFNLANDNYNGPYGNDVASQDGLFWLNGKVIEFNTNVPEVSNTPPGIAMNSCPDLTVCQGQTVEFDVHFVSGNTTQIVTVQLVDADNQMTYSTSPFPNGVSVHCQIIGTPDNIGTHTIVLIGTDDGDPTASTQITFDITVSAENSIALEITGDTEFCAGANTTLTATPGMDSYLWSNGSNTQSAVINASGIVTLYATLNGCPSSAEIEVQEQLDIPIQLCNGNTPVHICTGDTATLCVLGSYESYEWFIYPGYEGEFVPGISLNESEVQILGSVVGAYGINVIDANGCEGLAIVPVEITQLFIDPLNDENVGMNCNGLEPVSFTNGYAVPAPDNLVIYGLSTNNNGWQGSYINVTIIHPDNSSEVTTFTTTGALNILDDVFVNAGDSIIIEYFSNGNNFTGNSLWLINCGQSSPAIFNAPLLDGVIWQGMSTCDFEPLIGQWTATGPDGWSFSAETEFSTDFTPPSYGAYSLCFEIPICANPLCYEIEFVQPPADISNPVGANTVCSDDEIQNYSVAEVVDVLSYTWTISPEVAGVIVYTQNNAQVDFNDAFNGLAIINVYATNENCNTNLGQLDIQVNDCNLTSDIQEGIVRIFPNPASDQIQIVTSEKLKSVTVFDIRGKEIMTVSSSPVSVQSLAAGFYAIQVVTEKGCYRTLVEKK